MRKKTYQAKKNVGQAEKRLETKHYRWVIGLLIFTCFYYFFIEPETIGKDVRYSIFIFWIPTIIGMIALGFYRRRFLLNRFATSKGFVQWTFLICFYLLQGFLFSYLSFGQLAAISWDIANYRTAKQNSPEIIECDVTKFWTKGRRCSVDFQFNGCYESFKVSRQGLKDYKNKAPTDYTMEIKAQKGLLNYYLVNEWAIREK